MSCYHVDFPQVSSPRNKLGAAHYSAFLARVVMCILYLACALLEVQSILVGIIHASTAFNCSLARKWRFAPSLTFSNSRVPDGGSWVSSRNVSISKRCTK